MANFKGFKQVLLSDYTSTSEAEKKGYIWLVRDLSGETVLSSAIYFGTRKYAEINADAKESKIIESLGSMVDANGDWVGFLPIEEHEILGDAENTTDALEKLEAAIIAVKTHMASAESAITALTTEVETKADAADVTALAGRVTSAETDINALEVRADSADTRMDEIERVTASGLTALDTRMTSAETALAGKASQSDLTALAGRVTEAEGDITALTAEVATKANAADVYTKSQVYNKEEVDGKIAGAFKFMGNALRISDDKTKIYIQSGETEAEIVAAESNKGHVYQIGDKEYASNGSKWIELGFNIDLSAYAKKDYVDSAITVEEAARTAAVEAETAARLAKDNQLESAITVEQTARAAADTTLQANIDEVDSALTIEIQTRAAADELLNQRITAETAERQSLATRVTAAEGDIDNLEGRATISATTFEEADAKVSAMTQGQIIYVNTDEGTASGRTAGAYIKIGNALKKLDISSGSGDTPLSRIESLETKVGNTALPGEGTTLTSAVAALLTVTGEDVEE